MNSTPHADKSMFKARVAVIHVDRDSQSMLTDCFKQFDVECIAVDTADHISRQKFDGCVIGVDHPNANVAFETLRKSPSNLRAVVYGLEKQPNGAAPYLRYGVSVVLREPLDRFSVVKAVRSTRALLLNEFRRYVRIPIAVHLSVDTAKGFFGTYTEEISGGGLSFKVPGNSTIPEGKVRLAFTLPGAQKLQMEATTCWHTQEDRGVGVRFEPNDPGRQVVRQWVDEYLQLS